MDVATGTLGLVGLAAATAHEDRTTSLNWMLPYTVGSIAGLALGVERGEAMAEVATLSGVYLATAVRPGTRPGQVVTAIANAASYVGFHAVAAAVIRRGRREGAEVDMLRAESAQRGERLAIERERNRQHRLLHDSALQTLEGIASGLVGDDKAVRARARTEARRVRQALAGVEPDGDLATALEALATDMAASGLEVSCSVGRVGDLAAPAQSALVEATREALRNIVKHAGVNAAVVRADTDAEALVITVRDHGRGFDPETRAPGFGLRQSVAGRLAEVEGSVEVWSQPGRGTRVTLRVPSP